MKERSSSQHRLVPHAGSGSAAPVGVRPSPLLPGPLWKHWGICGVVGRDPGWLGRLESAALSRHVLAPRYLTREQLRFYRELGPLKERLLWVFLGLTLGFTKCLWVCFFFPSQKIYGVADFLHPAYTSPLSMHEGDS